ncbi:MAG: glycosyltransferase [Chloroflexi bacterium]|nr:glycosyltransferase [Chloroflexota bacterium]
MKILQVATSDRAGGAAIGAYRLHQALRKSGIESEMLVLRKVTADPYVRRLSAHLSRWERARRRLAQYRHHRLLAANPRHPESGHWSLNLFSYPIAKAINSIEADIVHLQWVGDNTLPIAEVAKIAAPIVWTLQDMWAFTGGCHYAGESSNYRTGAGNCCQLLSPRLNDISARVYREKLAAWSDVPLTVVCLSQWLAECANSSTVMKDRQIEVIGNSVDAKVFKTLDKTLARQAFNLPPDKKLILFGAIGGTSDRRKGFAYLHEALSGLEAGEDRELVIFGGENPVELELPLSVHQVGKLQDELSLSLLYGACDVYVLPTLQEAFGNTLIEALASGTPCVTFDGSGAVDIVRHEQNGYVARLRDSADLLRGIEWALAQSWSREKLHSDIIERYGAEQVAQQYIGLYQSLLGQST